MEVGVIAWKLNKRTITDHSSEQKTHEQGPCDKEEDDEDADDFIQRSLQPHYHLSAFREGDGQREQGGNKEAEKILQDGSVRVQNHNDQRHGETCVLPRW